MKRLFSPIAPLPSVALRAHSHSHGDGGSSSHGHSHSSTIEADVKGDALRRCKLATLVGAASNALLCVSKIGLGTAAGSVAVVADGVHALGDLVSDGVAYASVALATTRYPRCWFPYGIGRIETVGATFIAAILLMSGMSLIMTAMGQMRTLAAGTSEAHNQHHEQDDAHNSHAACDHHDHEDHDHGHHDHGFFSFGHSHVPELTITDEHGNATMMWSLIALCAMSLVCKEVLYRWTRRIGEQAGSRVVVANAYHHRADAWSAGVALVGVAGQLAGVPGADSAAGLVVAASVTRVGVDLLSGSILEFFDYQPANSLEELRHKLAAVLEQYPIVNVFLTRHGHSYVLHATLLVTAADSAKLCSDVTKTLHRTANEMMSVSEVFLGIQLCDVVAPCAAHEGSIEEVILNIATFHGVSAVPVVEPAAGGCASRREMIVAARGAKAGMVDMCYMHDLKTIGRMFNCNVRVLP